MTDKFKIDPFVNCTLEDIIRYLATWDLPEDRETSKAQEKNSRMIKAILLLCREWSQNEG